MVDVNTQNKTISVNVSSSGVSSNVNASGDTTMYYSNKAREWAISNKIVDGVDYSSKYYAGRANQSALNAQSFAQSAQDSYNNFQQSVDDALSNVDSTVQSAITTIDTKSGEVIENIGIEANEQIANIERTGFYMRDDKLYFINSVGEEEEFKSGGDTLPLFHNFYSQEDMTSTGAYVNASLGSWLSGNVYETTYNELVNKIGTDNVKAVTDAYTDYDFVVNQDDMTFRLPLLNGKEFLPSDNKISQPILASGESYTAPQNGWYSYLVVSSVANGTVNLYCEETGLAHLTQANANMASRGSIPVSKGDVVNYIYPTNSTNILFFVPAKGDGSLYYKVANAVTNLELLNAGEVLNAVNLKADINLSNVNENGKSLMSGMAMPSNKYIDITLGAAGSTYIAPANGWFALAANATSDGYLFLNANNMETVDQHDGELSVFMPVKKNDTVSVGYGGAISQFRYFRLIYAQGSESEV